MPDEPQDQQPQEQPLTTPSLEPSSEPGPVSSSPEVPIEAVPEVEVEPATNELMTAPANPTDEVSDSEPVESVAGDVTSSPAMNETSTPINLEPGADTTPPPVAPIGSSKNGGKKKWLIGGIIAVVLVLLIGGGALAYNLWYQNPQKVILDGVVHLLTDKTSRQASVLSTFENKDATLTVNGDMKSSDSLANGSLKVTAGFKGTSASLGNINLSVDMATTKSAAYFKVTGLKAAVDDFVNSMVDSMTSAYQQSGLAMSQQEIAQEKQTMESEFAPVVSKIEGQWIKVDTTQSSSNSDSSQCVATAVNKLSSDTSEQNELKKVYNDNQFITVKKKLGSKDGSLGYDLGYDQAKAKQFNSALESTAFAAQLKKCDSSIFANSNSTSTSSNDMKNVDFQVWVSRWTHQITEVKLSSDSLPSSTDGKFTADLQIKYGSVSGLTTPTNATDIKDIESQMNSLLGGSSSTDSSATATFSI
jgi:hypothetical protein